MSWQIAITKQLDIKELRNLYEQVGWLESCDSDERLARLVDGSFRVVACWAEGHLIGFGRALSDGISDAYLQDIVVDRLYRGRGIGGELVQCLTEECLRCGITNLFLIAVPKATEFYKKIGWKPLDDFTAMTYSVQNETSV